MLGKPAKLLANEPRCDLRIWPRAQGIGHNRPTPSRSPTATPPSIMPTCSGICPTRIFPTRPKSCWCRIISTSTSQPRSMRPFPRPRPCAGAARGPFRGTLLGDRSDALHACTREPRWSCWAARDERRCEPAHNQAVTTRHPSGLNPAKFTQDVPYLARLARLIPAGVLVKSNSFPSFTSDVTKRSRGDAHLSK